MSNSNSNNLPTIAFFGATGGVTNSSLVYALRNSRNCIALARTPSKLRKQLLSQNLTEETLNTHLTIVQGDALDKTAVKQTLSANSSPNHLITSIVTGLGAAPVFRWHWSNPLSFFTIDNPTICGSAAGILLESLKEIYDASPTLKQTAKPDLVFVSTTGVSQPRGAEDVPLAMRFLYHQVLAVPHIDKREMERLYRDNVDGKDTARGVLFSSVVGIRPTLLTGAVNADSGIGLDKIRSGTEQKPAMGYTIRRADVGHWIWEELIQSPEKRKGWGNEMISLTS